MMMLNQMKFFITSSLQSVSENVLAKKPTNTDRDWITPETLVQIQQKTRNSQAVSFKISRI